ncbi:MAG: exodeoxyribonuclease VII small subunit [Acidithiobacillus ferrivorans]|uniref:Exodeoxyribonuclease 7 small subunit n=2 Tax=Acidithiobacillus TaxID=119977 RepID=A0A257SZR3_9PROT|nr:MAG: exodeoxyribonuclease VII small subunit [Acidithiobacillus ferrivorans]
MRSAMKTPAGDDPRPVDFESTLEALEDTVKQLESGQLRLEESIALFQRGAQLARRCEEQLQQARQTVEILLAEADAPVPFLSEEDQ